MVIFTYNLKLKGMKAELEEYIEEIESKIWEIQNSNKVWIPDSQAKKDAMIKSFQTKIDKAKKRWKK
jgi:hypothetical protein